MFQKYSNIKLKIYKNPSCGSRVFRPHSRTDGQTDRKTDITKLIVALRNFANATKTILSNKLGIIHPVAFYVQKYQQKFTKHNILLFKTQHNNMFRLPLSHIHVVYRENVKIMCAVLFSKTEVSSSHYIQYFWIHSMK